MMVRRMKLLCSLVMMLASHSALAVSYPLPPEGESSGWQPDEN